MVNRYAFILIIPFEFSPPLPELHDDRLMLKRQGLATRSSPRNVGSKSTVRTWTEQHKRSALWELSGNPSKDRCEKTGNLWAEAPKRYAALWALQNVAGVCMLRRIRDSFRYCTAPGESISWCGEMSCKSVVSIHIFSARGIGWDLGEMPQCLGWWHQANKTMGSWGWQFHWDLMLERVIK